MPIIASTETFNRWRTVVLPLVLALACSSCGESTGPLPPPLTPSAADLRFKGVGTTTPTHATRLGNMIAPQVQLWTNTRGTPLDIEQCAPPSPGGANCNWELAFFAEPVGTADVSTVYNSTGVLSALAADLAVMQHGTLIAAGVDVTSMITALFIDVPSNLYATSGYQTSDVHDFDLTFGSLALNALQAAAAQAGAQGRVITALDFNGGNVAYLSYGWSRDRATVYDAQVVVASFSSVAAEAKNLASQGYIITAVGGNLSDGFLLIGTRVSGQSAPRALSIETDSVQTSPPNVTVDKLTLNGYAVLGTIFGHHPGDSHMFNIFIGEK